MIGLCQAWAKALPTRFGGARFFLISSPRVLASRPWFLDRTRLPFAGAAFSAAQKIEFVFSCQSRNLSTEHWELALLRPVGLTARPGRLRAEEILLVRRQVLCSDVATRLCYLKIPLPTVNGQYG